ncbi:hypothetical protein [Xanthomonas campestris]|uniref:hypothetical protein n=1 Tax=Xanthomonas campestris TaxID=339 RepID=UPI0012906CFB|nr:hypothetical protein [Xanthomonas campestris]
MDVLAACPASGEGTARSTYQAFEDTARSTYQAFDGTTRSTNQAVDCVAMPAGKSQAPFRTQRQRFNVVDHIADRQPIYRASSAAKVSTASG